MNIPEKPKSICQSVISPVKSIKSSICRQLEFWKFTEIFCLGLIVAVILYLSLKGETIYGRKIEGFFGLLTFFCIPPIATLLCAYLRKRSWLLLVSLVLAIIPLMIFIYIVYSENSLSSLMLRVLLSSTYGFICAYSCFVGLKIQKNGLLDNAFQMFKENMVFISVVAAIFLFILERIRDISQTEYVSFVFFFDFLALAVSFTYIAFGHFSKDKSNPNPLAFFISSFLSFSIGFMFSAFIIELWRNLGGMPSHWPFICVWTVFFATISLSLEKNPEIGMQAREVLRWLTEELD